MRVSRRSTGGPTVDDVARHAGVSAMTVSRVVNGSPRVRDATRAAVLASIEALQYRPNQAARNLAAGASTLIGLPYSNPSDAYLSQFLIGALEGSRAGGYHLVLEKLDEDCLPEAESIADMFVKTEVRGVVLPPPLSGMPALQQALTAAEIPWIAVAAGTSSPEVQSIGISNRDAAFAMTRHLLDLGHRNIAFIRGHPEQSASVERYKGYADALRASGLNIEDMAIEPGLFTFRSGLEAAERILASNPRPTAIFASNDDMAAAAVGAAHRHGLNVPGDISVVGFDDTALATSIWPSLTTIRQPTADMARTAVELLLRRVAEESEPGPNELLLPFELVIRDSSGPVPQPAAT